MDIWGKYKSALGYQNNDCGIDSFGVNHNGFSLRDELAYQMARSNREQELIQNYNNRLSAVWNKLLGQFSGK